MIQKRKTPAQKLAETAAKKKGSPPPNVSTPKKAEKSEQAEHTVTVFFKEKLIPSANSTEFWRKKIATKSILDHSLQFEILDRADQLILISNESKLSDSDFKPTFVTMYGDIVELQNRQDWTRACWKVVVVPLYVPPIDQMTCLVCGIFHTSKNIPAFSNWNIAPGLNLDFKLSKDPFVEQVDQPNSKNAESSLAESESSLQFPPHTQPRGDDWLDLPELNESSVSAVGPIPLNMESDSDFENSMENSFVATFNASSYLPLGPINNKVVEDISCPTESKFMPKINSTKRGLTKGEKLSILEGKNEFRPILRSEMKRTSNINRGRTTRYIPYDFFAKFLIGLVGKNQN